MDNHSSILFVALNSNIHKKTITFFLVNTKASSSNVLQTSVILFVLLTREITDIFNTFDEIYLVFTSKKKISSIIFVASRCSLLGHVNVYDVSVKVILTNRLVNVAKY